MAMATAGKMILPIGTRFNPSDDELVDYLKRKLDGIEEKHCLIPELDVYKYPPWDLITMFNKLSVLPSDGGKSFFFYRPSRPKGKRNSQKTPHGFWGATGHGRKPRQSDPTKWSKNYLVHRMEDQKRDGQGKKKRGSPTGYAMHIYMIMSNTSIVLCYVHDSKSNKGEKPAGLVSHDADMIGSPPATAASDTQVQPRETSPEEHLGNVVGSQTSIQPFSDAFSPELLEVILQSDRSAGSPQNPVPAAENRVSQQANRKETRDFATESSEDNEDFDISQFLNSSLDLVSHEADMIGSPLATPPSHTRVQPQETTTEASVVTTVESQNLTPPSGANVAEYSTSSRHQKQMMVADETFSEDVYTDGDDFIQLEDIPLCFPNLMRDQSPCPENTFMHGCDQEYSTRWSYPQEDVIPDQGGSINILHHNPTSQLPDDVVPGSISPPQQPQAMHTEEISPIIGHTSFIGSGKDMMYPLMNTHGQDASPLVVSMNRGLDETNTKEAPLSASNSQTLIPSQNHVELSLELLKMVREWSRNYNIFPSSDSFEGGITNTSYFGQSCESQQTNLEATPDFAAEQTVETEFSELETLLESFFADSPAPVSVTDSLTGGYSTEYRGVPYASVDGTFDATNPSMSKGY